MYPSYGKMDNASRFYGKNYIGTMDLTFLTQPSLLYNISMARYPLQLEYTKRHSEKAKSEYWNYSIEPKNEFIIWKINFDIG